MYLLQIFCKSWVGRDTFLTFVVTLYSMSEKEENEMDETQKNQNKPGKAESNPETSGPAENLIEEAAEMVDDNEGNEDPA